ncbi:MAG: ribonuclease P protein component [Candidimonas sp.]|nr:MAG: ribonuclease P protein component [Candidimonas sp.]
MRATFPASARLHRPAEFSLALKGRQLARGTLLTVSSPRRATGASNATAATARLGVIVAKRFAARAVTRNTIKRVVREAFRQKRHALPPRDLVFRLHGTVRNSSLAALRLLIRTEAEELLERVRQ